MGMKLKTCVASMAMLVAAAAHAEVAVSTSASAEGNGTYQSAEASGGERLTFGSGAAYGEVADGQAHAMNLAGEHAGAGGGSGEAKLDRAATSASERNAEANWNRQEFQRNIWTTP